MIEMFLCKTKKMMTEKTSNDNFQLKKKDRKKKKRTKKKRQKKEKITEKKGQKKTFLRIQDNGKRMRERT